MISRVTKTQFMAHLEAMLDGRTQDQATMVLPAQGALGGYASLDFNWSLPPGQEGGGTRRELWIYRENDYPLCVMQGWEVNGWVERLSSGEPASGATPAPVYLVRTAEDTDALLDLLHPGATYPAYLPFADTGVPALLQA